MLVNRHSPLTLVIIVLECSESNAFYKGEGNIQFGPTNVIPGLDSLTLGHMLLGF